MKLNHSLQLQKENYNKWLDALPSILVYLETFRKMCIDFDEILVLRRTIFIFLVGPSESGKTHLIFNWLIVCTFQPAFDKTFLYFFQQYQLFYSQMRRKTLNLSKE